MHEMGLQGPKSYIFGDQFYWKNTRKLRLCVFLQFHVRKHDTITLPEVDQIHKKLWILFQFSSGPLSEQNSQFHAYFIRFLEENTFYFK